MQQHKPINIGHKKESQNGFTLFEVVAVLVLLGILSAFAIPKFFDMQGKAKEKALNKAVAELNGQVSVSYFNNLLEDQEKGDFEGYSGSLGPDFIITDQVKNKPQSGTIKLSNYPEAYTLIWNPSPHDNSPGFFSLGPPI